MNYTKMKINNTLIDETNSGKFDTIPIHEFVSKYNWPHSVANKLIGETENETEENIRKASEAIDKYAEKYSEKIVEKIKENTEPFRQWNAPYGYKKSADGKFVPIPNEQKVIRFIIRMGSKGVLISDIIKKLKEANIKTRRGNTDWGDTVIRRILRRENDNENTN